MTSSRRRLTLKDYIVEINFITISAYEQKKCSDDIVSILLDNAVKIANKKLTWYVYMIYYITYTIIQIQTYNKKEG